jgi:DNA-binding beta-propeller fold protein YncE
MKTIRFLAVVVSLFGLALPASADTLVVLNKSEHTASLIDPESGKTLAKLPVGRGPHEVIVSSDGHTAYVSNLAPTVSALRETRCARRLATRSPCLISQSARSRRPTTTAPTRAARLRDQPRRQIHMGHVRNAAEVWVGMPADNKLAVISTANDEVTETLPSGGAHGAAHRYLDLPSRLSLHR